MSDSFSSLLNLRFQQTGGNNNTWGDLLNTDVFTPLESAIAGRVSHAVTGGALDLSATPLVEQVQVFTGVLTSDETVTIPNLSKRMLVVNNTTGSFFLLLKTASGTAICIPQGTSKDVHCDGSNNLFRLDRHEIGEIKSFAGSAVPSGYLECDGSAIKRAKAPDLYAKLGTTWGAGNGVDDFVLPDFKTAGRFLRSRTGSVAVGTLQAADIAAHNHTASATTSVTITSLSIASDGAHSHTITITDPGHVHPNSKPVDAGTSASVSGAVKGWNLTSTDSATTGITASSNSTGAHTHSGSTGTATATTSVTVNNSTGTETRPINASVIMAVRY